MAITATDVSVAVNGDIRWTGGGTPNYTVLELHRFLQNLADDAAGTGDDLLDITSDTPSDRSTDNIITLLGTFNIDDTMAEHLYDGSISQTDGDTVYSGLRVLGAVNTAATQLEVIQDSAFYQTVAPFWGDQSTGGYNGISASGVLMRILVKSRDNGADIDGKRIRVQARHWGDTYDFFNVTLGLAESVAAISSTPDAQNTTTQSTVLAYTHVVNSNTTIITLQDETSYDNSPTSEGVFTGGTNYSVGDVITLDDGSTITVDLLSANVVTQFTANNSASGGVNSGVVLAQKSVVGAAAAAAGFTLTPDTDNIAIDEDTPIGGFQLINLNNGNGNQEYYSKWTYGADTSGDGLGGVWEYIKDVTGNLTAKYVDGIFGEFFLGVTHSWAYDTESGGPFNEHETIVWGTDITYDTLAGGTFDEGQYVTIGILEAAGKIVYDNGSTNMIVALEDTSITLVDGDVITVADGVGAVTAAINTTILDNGDPGGEGILLALDDDGTTGNFYIQLISGAAPVATAPLRGIRSSATALVTGSIVARTVPKVFLGSYTGNLIGAYGIGVTSGNLTASDTVEDLAGATQTPPNNVTFTVSGVVSGEDRVLVGPRQTGVLDKNQFLITSAVVTGNTSIVSDTVIPTDTPTEGTIRLENNAGVYLETRYDSYTANTFTLSGTYGDSAAIGNDLFIAYIDLVANTTTATFTTIYLSDRELFVRVRDGGSTPIKTFEGPATLGTSGGSVAAIRTTDA